MLYVQAFEMEIRKVQRGIFEKNTEPEKHAVNRCCIFTYI